MDKDWWVEYTHAEKDIKFLNECREHLRAQLDAVTRERDEARRQLETCQAGNRRFKDFNEKILADNAALVEMTKVRQDALCRVRAMNWNLGGPANRDANGAWVVHPDWEQKMLGIIADAIGPLNGDAPLGDHPGAGLLAELAALRKALEQIAVLAIRDNDNTGTLMLAVEIATDAIRKEQADV